jgi:hypothetical protein
MLEKRVLQNNEGLELLGLFLLLGFLCSKMVNLLGFPSIPGSLAMGSALAILLFC